ncbi:MAG: YigZ family protein [Oscillospiraceae bacterium]|nr:YigZ family protein [Oscillospiraceae bacterium]
MEKEYLSLLGEAEAELVEKKSKFIARCAPVEGEAAALAFIASVKACHKTATHNVWAYVLRENNLTRYTDDGEPQGTSGLPVLDCLRGRLLTDAAVVVTRYFGGTLLGKGGLVRAYSSAAALAIERAGTALVTPSVSLLLKCPYGDYEKLLRLLERFGAAVESEFQEEVALSALIKEAELEPLKAELRELTGGRISAQEVSRGFQRLPCKP